MTPPRTGDQALAGWRVVDLTTELGYAAKLYADLGAEVVLVEPPGGSEARRRPPRAGERSLWFDYRNAGKTHVELDLDDTGDVQRLASLLGEADIVFDDRPQSFWRARGLAWAQSSARWPDLVWCVVTPYGLEGPASDRPGSDLTAMASGGMAWLGGYEDTGPLVSDVGLATTSAAQYAAVVALVAALGRANTGGGQLVDVSMQEVVALGTETAPQFLEMKGVVRRRLGERARQAGIGVYPCADGHVFLYAAESGVGRGWNLLAGWLAEAGAAGAGALLDPAWQDNGFKAQPAQRERFAAVWQSFAAQRSRQALFDEGQRRRIAISPVNHAVDVLADPHLRARSFFDSSGGPGAPYRLSATPWRHAGTGDRTRVPAARTRTVLPRVDGGGLPLAGLRVIDLTWVGAGPFTTKLLADFGADVWKIESPDRPDQLRRAEPLAAAGGLDASGYFANRNTNKKSVTLDLKRPGAVERILGMLRNADVLANSFSPGVMERLGLGWGKVSAVNPRLVGLSMPFAGEDGPYRDCLGYGMNIAALVGQFARHALPGRLPVGTGTNFPDHLPNPLHACFALLAALAWREHSGQGQHVAVSQVESTLAACPDAVLEVAATGKESSPGSYFAHRHGPTGIFRCAGDDRWCAVDVADAGAFARLAALLGGSLPTPDEAAARLAAWTRDREPRAVVDALHAARIAAAIVADPIDLRDDPQLRARAFWQRLPHPVIGRALYHGVAARLSRTSVAYRSGAPLLGEPDAALP
ncbi:MAG: CoA transferase, partial [Burkholderiales bacterium]|nr:CoA transferase [Burkholderiales bacterium]